MSLVVQEPFRGQGIARTLCDAMESYARATGVNALYLLTMLAAGIFRGIGFTEISKETVPAEVQQIQVFPVFCPSTATCMIKRLI